MGYAHATASGVLDSAHKISDRRVSGSDKGGHAFADGADAQRFRSGSMALYNEVVHSLTALAAHCCPPSATQPRALRSGAYSAYEALRACPLPRLA